MSTQKFKTTLSHHKCKKTFYDEERDMIVSQRLVNFIRGCQLDIGQTEEFLELWASIEKHLPPVIFKENQSRQ